MDTKGRLVAGSHNRNEFVLINADEIARVTSVKELSGQICQICGDETEISIDGEPFVACNECAFPVCRPCYEYERSEGNQACPQCKTRYKRIKGCPRVEGDEEEDGADDLENEFDIASQDRRNPHHIAAVILSARLNISRGSQPHVSGISTPAEFDAASVATEIPLLTYGEEDAGISSDKHALIIPPFMSRGKRVHSMPVPDPSMTLPPRPMDPKKDLGVYGYGTVAWKERMEDWKKKQNEKHQVVKHEGYNGDEFDDPDLPVVCIIYFVVASTVERKGIITRLISRAANWEADELAKAGDSDPEEPSGAENADSSNNDELQTVKSDTVMDPEHSVPAANEQLERTINEGAQPCSTLFIANLGPNCTEYELKEVLSKYPGFNMFKIRAKGGMLVAFADFEICKVQNEGALGKREWSWQTCAKWSSRALSQLSYKSTVS